MALRVPLASTCLSLTRARASRIGVRLLMVPQLEWSENASAHVRQASYTLPPATPSPLERLRYLIRGSVTFYPRLLKQPLTEGARFGVPCAQSVPLQYIRFFSLQPSGSDGRFNSGRLLTLRFFFHGSVA